jgi:hypothetical protein
MVLIREKTSTATSAVVPSNDPKPRSPENFRFHDGDRKLWWKGDTTTAMSGGSYEVQRNRNDAGWEDIATVQNSDFSNQFEVFYQDTLGIDGDLYRVRSVTSLGQPSEYTPSIERPVRSDYCRVIVDLQPTDYYYFETKTYRSWVKFTRVNTDNTDNLDFLKKGNQLLNLRNPATFRLEDRIGRVQRQLLLKGTYDVKLVAEGGFSKTWEDIELTDTEVYLSSKLTN